MITHHSLPSGATVDLRDPGDVTERHKRPVRNISMLLAKDGAFAGVVEAAKKDGVAAVADVDEEKAVSMMADMGADALDLMDQMADRIIIGRVAGWSFPVEVSLDALLDLTSADYDALKVLTAKGALDGPDMSPSMDEDSPTVPSIASA